MLLRAKPTVSHGSRTKARQIRSTPSTPPGFYRDTLALNYTSTCRVGVRCRALVLWSVSISGSRANRDQDGIALI